MISRQLIGNINVFPAIKDENWKGDNEKQDENVEMIQWHDGEVEGVTGAQC